MSNVNLEIGGRSFTVACAPGEEEHVTGLGRMIGSKLAEMDGIASQSEARMLLFASLLLADELHEARGSQPAAGPAPAPAPSTGPASPSDDVLDGIATQLENLAGRLESALRRA